MEERKHMAIGGGILLILGLVFGLPTLNWFRFEMGARDLMSDKGVGRFPDAQKILGLVGQLQSEAKAKGFGEVQVSLRLYERKMPPTSMWFLNVKMTEGSRSFVQERRIESKFGEEAVDLLRENGCTVEPLPEDEEDDDSGEESSEE